MSTDQTPISKACQVLGGQAQLARAIGVSCPTVNQWVKGIRPIPTERMVSIEAATGGAVRRQDLRPDDWRRIWPELIGQQPADAAGQGVGHG